MSSALWLMGLSAAKLTELFGVHDVVRSLARGTQYREADGTVRCAAVQLQGSAALFWAATWQQQVVVIPCRRFGTTWQCVVLRRRQGITSTCWAISQKRAVLLYLLGNIPEESSSPVL